MNIFFTSDTHFGHANIIPLAQRPWPYEIVTLPDGQKKFIVPPKSVEEMNDTLIEKWNSKVKKGDLVFHLGDFAWYVEAAKKALDRLNGNIVLIEGNHDYPIKGMTGRFASVQKYREVEYGVMQPTVLFHYPIRSWNGIFKGHWHLHGHTHNLLPPFGKSFDIGVDNWDFYPLSLEEVAKEMEKRPFQTEEAGFANYTSWGNIPEHERLKV